MHNGIVIWHADEERPQPGTIALVFDHQRIHHGRWLAIRLLLGAVDDTPRGGRRLREPPRGAFVTFRTERREAYCDVSAPTTDHYVVAIPMGSRILDGLHGLMTEVLTLEEWTDRIALRSERGSVRTPHAELRRRARAAQRALARTHRALSAYLRALDTAENEEGT